MKNRIITGLVVIGLSYLLGSQANAFHSDIDLSITRSNDTQKKIAKTDGMVVIAFLLSEDFDFDNSKWFGNSHWYADLDGKHASKYGTRMDSIHCFPSFCLYAAKLVPGSYSISQLTKTTHEGNIISTMTVPVAGLGGFEVEAGKITNLGMLGIFKGEDSSKGSSKSLLGRQSFRIGFYADYMSSRNAGYIAKAVVAGNKRYSADGALGWSTGANFEKSQAVKNITGTMFQDFSRVVQGDDGRIYMPTTLGDIYTIDASANYDILKTGVNMRLHALYPEKDFYLLGGEAGKLYSYKPGQEEATVIGELDIEDFVTDIIKHDGLYYAIVLSGSSQLKVYRFSGLEAPNFELLEKFQISASARGGGFDTKDIRKYELVPAAGGFFVKLGIESLGYFDFKEGKLVKIKPSEAFEQLFVQGDGSVVAVGAEIKIPVSKASAEAESGEVQLVEMPKEPRAGITEKKGVTPLIRSADPRTPKTWETLALLNGDIVSNICFSSPETGYLVLRKNIYDRGRSQYDYTRGQLIKTRDGGRSWEAKEGTLAGNNFEISCSRNKLTLIDKNESVIQFSTDDGKTWSADSIYGISAAVEKAKTDKAGKK